MLKIIGKGVLGFIVFLLAFYLASSLTYIIVLFLRNDFNGWAFYISAFIASVAAGGIGVVVGATLLKSLFKDYPVRSIGGVFILLQGSVIISLSLWRYGCLVTSCSWKRFYR